MDAIVKSFPNRADADTTLEQQPRPTQVEVEAAVRVLLRWTGDNPDREGLVDTPKRVAKAYREMFSGYDQDPFEELGRTFEEVAGYDDLVLIRDIPFHSHCEHHMVPIIGKAHVGYLPDGKVVGLSKIARVVDIFAHRLQTQEAMTAQIAGVIQDALTPRGVAVVIEAEHMCMAMRGIRVLSTDGIVEDDVEKTISNFAELGNQGSVTLDQIVLDMMLKKEKKATR